MKMELLCPTCNHKLVSVAGGQVDNNFEHGWKLMVRCVKDHFWHVKIFDRLGGVYFEFL